MRTVFDSRMTAHVWAQGRQLEGRNSNGQFYFEGPALWSYGRHWLVGFLLPDGAALINGDSRSVTTSKHTSFARYAVRGRSVTVPDLTGLYEAGLRRLVDDSPAHRTAARPGVVRHVTEKALSYNDESGPFVLGLVGRASSWPRIKREAEKRATKAERDAAAREIKNALNSARRAVAMTPAELRDHAAKVTDHGLEYMAREWGRFGRLIKGHASPLLQKQFKARVAELRAVIAESQAAGVADWMAGKRTNKRFTDAHGGAYVRAVNVERDEAGRIVGGELETSHGASVPLIHALKAFAFVRLVVAKCRADSTCEGWHTNGRTIRVGHFRVDSISSDGTMRAGCHTIHFDEMERLAAALGVADVAPSDEALETTGRAYA